MQSLFCGPLRNAEEPEEVAVCQDVPLAYRINPEHTD